MPMKKEASLKSRSSRATMNRKPRMIEHAVHGDEAAGLGAPSG